MGIDVYLFDPGFGPSELDRLEYKDWPLRSSLRESYHGGPYALRLLFREAWEECESWLTLPASTYEERLTMPVEVTPTRADAAIATAIPAIINLMEEVGIADIHRGTHHTNHMSVEEAARIRQRDLYGIDYEDCTEVARIQDFITLAMKLENEHGIPPTVWVSH